jgi:hypothetical protein
VSTAKIAGRAVANARVLMFYTVPLLTPLLLHNRRDSRYTLAMTLDKTTGIRLTPDLMSWLQSHAAKRRRTLGRRFTVSDVIRIALEEYRERNSP